MKKINASNLKFKSDLKGLVWRRKSYCYLNKWHDLDYMYKKGHPYNSKLPEITEVKMSDIIKYNEVMYDVFEPEFHKLPKYDINSPVVDVTRQIPDLGINVVEVDESTPVGKDKLTYGLFIYDMDKDSTCYEQGMKIGDTIVGITRTLVKKPIDWKPSHLDYEDDDDYGYTSIKTIDDMFDFFNKIHVNENVVIHVYREDKYLDFKMNIKFVKTRIKIFDEPRIVIRRIPDMEIVNEYLYMYYYDSNDWLTRSYEGFDMEVKFKTFDDEGNDMSGETEDGQLVVSLPETIMGTKYEIDNEGNLVILYE